MGTTRPIAPRDLKKGEKEKKKGNLPGGKKREVGAEKTFFWVQIWRGKGDLVSPRGRTPVGLEGGLESGSRSTWEPRSSRRRGR